MTKSSQDDQDLIRAIAELLNKENLAEIEIEKEDFRVRVTRSYANEAPVYAQAPQYFAPQPAAAPATLAPAGSVPAAAPAAAEDLASNPGTLTSPMVGTAYRSPEPGKPTFAEHGGELYWLNVSAKGELWLNAKPVAATKKARSKKAE